MSVLMREVTLDDLPEVLRLYYEAGVDRELWQDLAAAEALFTRLQHYPNYTIWLAMLAVSSSQAVGTFSLLIMDSLVHSGTPAGVVEGVAVDPSFQGQGIGRQMMQHAIALCRDAGCYKMSLSTNLKREKAHAFYESLGFEKRGYSFSMPLDE
jgi:GNAT superfamily N-acetyltransferase